MREEPDDRSPSLAAAKRGIVLHGTGGVWVVRAADGETFDAALRGRLKQAPDAKLAVGDDVLIAPDRRSTYWAIEEIYPRRSVLSRREPGGRHGERVLAANIDQVLVVFAATHPEPHRGMIDRFLVIAESSHLSSRLVVNKVDLADSRAARDRFADYERAGYPVHFTSTKTSEGLQLLHDTLAGRTTVVAGPSGVGKSSLLNVLYPGLNLRVGAISSSVNKGRHTTVGAWSHPLPDGGFVVDTPGLREVGLWGLAADELDRCFPEMRPFIGHCRFADCTHLVEPGCAVRTALSQGVVSAERYASYVKLREEEMGQRETGQEQTGQEKTGYKKTGYKRTGKNRRGEN
jgi:ribosome biogenesis GTPase / thiamine phosphate phosphatase